MVEVAPEAASADAPGASDDGVPGRRRGRRRLVVALIALVALVAGGLLAAKLTANSPTSTAAPLPAPPHFSLPRLGPGPAVSYPSAATRDHPVVLVFFASWCTPCQKELPVVARFVRSEQKANSPVRFIGIDGNDQSSSGLAFAHRSGVTFPTAQDHQEAVAYQLGLAFLPDTAFISAKGRVLHLVEGAVSVPTLRHWIHVLTAA